MVKYETKKAFTLVETIITLTIVMLVVAMGMPTLTKKKAQPESVGLRGQYGCWYEGNTLYEQYYDERVPREPKKSVGVCKLRLDKRPSNFYIIATGSGSSTTSGELITRFTPTIDAKMEIIPAKAGSNNPTVIENSYLDRLEARSGAATGSSLISPKNIKSCKLISSGQYCHNNAKDVHGNAKKQQYCDLVAVIDADGGLPSYNIRINGCESFDESGNPETTHIISTSSLCHNTNRSNLNLDAISDTAVASASYDNEYRYASCDSEIAKDYVMEFEFHNSNFVPDKNLFDAKNNTLNDTFKNSSKMSRILKTMPHRRRSALTQQFIDANYGGPNKNGAVLVLW